MTMKAVTPVTPQPLLYFWSEWSPLSFSNKVKSGLRPFMHSFPAPWDSPHSNPTI